MKKIVKTVAFGFMLSLAAGLAVPASAATTGQSGLCLAVQAQVNAYQRDAVLLQNELKVYGDLTEAASEFRQQPAFYRLSNTVNQDAQTNGVDTGNFGMIRGLMTAQNIESPQPAIFATNAATIANLNQVVNVLDRAVPPFYLQQQFGSSVQSLIAADKAEISQLSASLNAAHC